MVNQNIVYGQHLQFEGGVNAREPRNAHHRTHPMELFQYPRLCAQDFVHYHLDLRLKQKHEQRQPSVRLWVHAALQQQFVHELHQQAHLYHLNQNILSQQTHSQMEEPRKPQIRVRLLK